LSCRYIKLGEVADVKNGYAFKSKDFVDTGIPIIKIKNITPPNVTLEDVQFVSGKIFEETKRFKVEYNDILISMTGSGANQMSSAVGKIGRVRFQDTALQNQRVGKIIVKDESKYDSNFLYYFLTQTTVLEFFVFNSTGSANQANISAKLIKDLLVPDIDIKCQKDIATVLSSLDKKIENNNKIIANLETQAQAIFKSRFVDFEPFQDGQFVESELGMIPEGWEVGKLGNSSLGKLLSSGINDFENQKIYLATADVTDSNITNYETKITMEDKPSRANMQPIKNSVWFAKMKDSRKLIYVGANDDFLVDEVIFSTGFAGIKAVESSVHYLWTYLLTEDFNTKKNLLSNGTTMQAINNTNINRIKIVIPKNNVLEDFNGLVKPMFELISSYKNQNLKLAQIRDTLLPKLMSGEIRVGQDDIEEIENLL